MVAGQGFEWGNFVAWLGFGLSLIIAINQFLGSRPRTECDRPESLLADGQFFVIRIWNPTPVAIHVYGYWSFKRKGDEHRALSSKVGDDYVDDRYPLGTINLLIPAGGVGELNATVMRGQWLLFAVRWRRMTGLHLFSFLPLLVAAGPKRLAAITKAAKAPVADGRGRER